MNSYNLSLVGSYWLLILFFLLSFGVAYFSYSKTQPQLTNFFKYLLISLRTLALLILFFIIFEPVLNIIKASFKKPQIAVLYDNSKSTGFKNNKINRELEYLKAINDAQLTNNKDIDLIQIRFSENAEELSSFSSDSLKFDGQITDLQKPFEYLKEKISKQPIHSVIIFTDGLYNYGTTPIYSAANLGVPVFPVGIGDTIKNKDLSIISILTNEYAYVDNPVQVRIKFNAYGYDGEIAKINIRDNGNLIEQKEIKLLPNQKEYSLDYNFLPKAEGIRRISVTIEEKQDETTNLNNSLTEYVNVLKNKRKVVIFGGYPNSDISFITQTLSLEKGMEVKQFIQKFGAEFYIQPTKNELSDAEMIVFSGFPISSTPQNVLDLIKSELESGKPLLFIAGLQTDYRKLEYFDDYLPFKLISSNAQEFTALPNFRKEALSSPIIKVNGDDNDINLWNQLPPLYKTETYVKPKPESEVLSILKVNNVPINEPLILSRKFQNKKSVAVMGYGLYRWKLLGYAADKSNNNSNAIDLFDRFINNSLRWLSVRNDSKNVIIKTNKKNYTNTEKIEFIAQVYDESLNPISNAILKVNLNSKELQKDISLNSIGNGQYNFILEPQKEGDYYFSGYAELNGKKLGSDNGKFYIGESPLEYLDLSLNLPLLKSLANETGGKYLNSNEASSIINEINKIKALEPIPFKESIELPLWNFMYLLILVILLLTIEWVIRKRLGLI